jgi:hypothetical protein
VDRTYCKQASVEEKGVTISFSSNLRTSRKNVEALQQRMWLVTYNLLADICAPVTNKRVIPLNQFSVVDRVVVPPDRHEEKKEHERSHQSVDLHRKRRHGRRAGHYYADVSYESHKRNYSRPQNQFQVGPLGRRSKAFGKSRLLDTARGRSSDHGVGASAGEQESQHSGAGIYMKEPFSVCQRDFLQVGTAALRAAQVHLVTPCSPTSVWLSPFLAIPTTF